MLLADKPFYFLADGLSKKWQKVPYRYWHWPCLQRRVLGVLHGFLRQLCALRARTTFQQVFVWVLNWWSSSSILILIRPASLGAESNVKWKRCLAFRLYFPFLMRFLKKVHDNIKTKRTNHATKIDDFFFPSYTYYFQVTFPQNFGNNLVPQESVSKQLLRRSNSKWFRGNWVYVT